MMRTKRTKWFIAVLVLVLVSMLTACGQPEPPKKAEPAKQAEPPKVYEMKLGSKMVEGHLESIAIKQFIKTAEERSNGRLKIVPYFGETLGSDKAQMENVMTGLQDFYVESYTFLQQYVPDFRVHSLPYLFKNNEEYRKFLLGPIQKEMEKQLLDKTGLRVVTEARNWLRGPYRVVIARKPIQSLADVKGLKIRQPDATTLVKTWSALGANVSIIPYSETYLAIQQGMVDAVTLPIGNLYSDKFCEIIKHVTITHEYPQQVCILMNDKKYQSLPDDLKKILIDAINEAGDYVTKIVNEEGSKMRKRLEDEYQAKFYEIDLAPWMAKAAEVHKELESTGFLPAGLVGRIRQSLDATK